MRKGLKRIFALFMALIMLMGGSLSAAAANEMSRENDYVDYLSNIEIEGTFYFDLGEYEVVDIPRTLRGAKHFEIYSNDDNIVTVTDDYEVYCELCGATILEIAEYDKNYDYIGSVYCLAIVRDDWDKKAKGSLVEAYDMYYDLNYKDEICVYPDVETRGDICTYIILPSGYIGDAVFIEGNDYVYAHSTGIDTFTAIVVDTNGNYQFVDVTFDVQYSFLQWIIMIFLLGFLWY